MDFIVSIITKASKDYRLNPSYTINFNNTKSYLLGLAKFNHIDFFINKNINTRIYSDYFYFLVYHEFAHIYHNHYLKKNIFYFNLGAAYYFTAYAFFKNILNPYVFLLSNVAISTIMFFDPLGRYFEKQADTTAIKFLGDDRFIKIRDVFRNI